MEQRMHITAENYTKIEETPHERAARLIKEGISKIEDSFMDVPEEEREAFEQKIKMKMKMGKPLSAKELNYLRIHDPEAYRSAMRVAHARKNLQDSLKRCRSKEEVSRVISNQLSNLRAMEKDPDREYMMAMVQREIEAFTKSGAYARLPETEKEAKAKGKVNKETKSRYEFSMFLQLFQESEILSGQLEKIVAEGGASV